MANSARIEELERKFIENPRRYFAPLANEFRKAGHLQRAIAICREFVPQQPAHMSGHIVFGQALFEFGDYTEAQTVFATALQLDPENLIALRHLGDIARLTQHPSEAAQWYRRVLEVDPRNEETASLLASVEAAPPAESRDAAAVTAEAPPEGHADVVGWGSINPEQTHDLPVDAIGDTTPPTAVVAESQTPAEEPHAAGEAAPPLGDTQPVRRQAEPIAQDAQHVELGVPDGTQEGPPPPPPPAFVTETMAELYLHQGHREEALKVYRQLVALRPGDQSLRDRVGRLEREVGAAPPPVVATPEPAKSEEAAAPAAVEAPRPAMASAGPVAGSPVPGAEASAPGVAPAPAAARPATRPLQQRSVREFFAAFAMRQAPPTVTVQADTAGAPDAAVTAPQIVAEIEPERPEEPRASEESDRPEAQVAAAADVEAPPAVAAEAEVPQMPVEASAPDAQADGLDPAQAPPGVPALPEAGIGIEPPDLSAFAISTYDPATFDAGGVTVEHDSFAVDEYGAESLAGGQGSTPRSPDFEYDQSMDLGGITGSTEYHGYSGTFEPSTVPTPAAEPEPESTPPPPPPRRTMHTGSVSVLFPGVPVPGVDEAAAATLAGAFGGTSPLQPILVPSPAVRPASNELSLDSIFGGDELAVEAEQFTHWLSGLKKK